VKLTNVKHRRVNDIIGKFKDSINFLIDKCVDNPIFQKTSKKGNVYYKYSSYPKIRKNFYFEWKSLFPTLHTHYCHSSARVTKEILTSWNSWCFKKKRRLDNPVYKKDVARLEKCLCYLEGNNLVLVIEPRTKMYIPLEPNFNYRKLMKEEHGEITIKLNDDKTIDIYIPFKEEVDEREVKSIVGIDINERSVDLVIIGNGQTRLESIDTSQISTNHYTYSLKRRNIAKSIDNDAPIRVKTRKELLDKYGKKERDKNKNDLHDVANQISTMVDLEDSIVVMEDLTDIRQASSREKNLKPWQQKKSKRMRRRLNRWNFRQFQTYLEYKVNSTGHPVEYINPRNTSKKCLKCGKLTKSKGHRFTCKHCGFSMNRHLQATMNIVEKYLLKVDKNVARTDPAERQRMTVLGGEFRETIARGASQVKNNRNDPVSST
jgi:putative transposase